MNHTEWQALAVLAAALAFVVAATAIQRFLGRVAARRVAAARPGAADAQPSEPVQPPVDLEASWGGGARDERRPSTRHVLRPTDRPPRSSARRRARQILRAPGGLRAAILAREILGPARGLSGPTDPQ